MLLENIDKVHTTQLGMIRIQKNLGIKEDGVVYCKRIITDPNCQIYKKGKNYYCEYEDTVVTVNSYSYTIITAKRNK